MEQKILVVDDDQQVTSFLERFFARHGYKSATAATAAELFKILETESFDLIILDLILPDEDGFEVAKRIRSEMETPLIMLTARDEVYDRIVGLELGADDYVTKPYEPRELLARMRSVMRRYAGSASRPETSAKALRFDALEIDLIRSVVRNIHNDSELRLTSTEFALLRALADAQGEVLTREQILTTVYGNSVQITDRAIDAHVVRLRKKLGGATQNEDLIRTVHGVGYKLAALVS
ncbi:response regulator transcription factor [uncultured Roseobacter sp.]|uniref:response regulator transcription factor n=1 Tax=uncultured Roseobacter sp. TaxID=114847 RepID=UPI002622D2B5|nr:response regulator transcription factor [uncultured Roseobacter sp.]